MQVKVNEKQTHTYIKIKTLYYRISAYQINSIFFYLCNMDYIGFCLLPNKSKLNPNLYCVFLTFDLWF